MFSDDGIMWKRGGNIEYVVKIQEAIREVEVWELEWGFRFSVAKTSSFSHKKESSGSD